MTVTNSSGLTRRRLLTMSAAAAAAAPLAGLLQRYPSASAHEVGGLPVLDAAYVAGRYVVLTGGGEHSYALHDLVVSGSGAASVGATYPVGLPDSLVPIALHGAGSRLLLSGTVIEQIGTVTFDNRSSSIRPDDLAELRALGPIGTETLPDAIVEVPEYGHRPAVFEATSNALRELNLGAGPRSMSAATSMAGPNARRLAVALQSSEGAAAGGVVRVAVSTDGGATWGVDVLADGLGHGYRTHLVDASGTYLALTVDESGARTLYRRDPSTARWHQVADPAPGGAISGALVDQSGELVVVDGDCDTGDCGGATVRQARYAAGQRRWLPARRITVDGDRVLGVSAVSGARGELLVFGEKGMHVVKIQAAEG